ncbi:MAG: mannonate dehydratase [Caldilineaceae bacterium]
MRLAMVSRPLGETDRRLAKQLGVTDMRPGHAPTMAGESNDNPGYMVRGKLFAIGYMRGLIDAVNSEVA